MDPELVNIYVIDQETRRRILKHVTEVKGISSTQLGFAANLINRAKHGKVSSEPGS